MQYMQRDDIWLIASTFWSIDKRNVFFFSFNFSFPLSNLFPLSGTSKIYHIDTLKNLVKIRVFIFWEKTRLLFHRHSNIYLKFVKCWLLHVSGCWNLLCWLCWLTTCEFNAFYRHISFTDPNILHATPRLIVPTTITP